MPHPSHTRFAISAAAFTLNDSNVVLALQIKAGIMTFLSSRNRKDTPIGLKLRVQP
jgi:hypothetical protein